ncbi:hypothetical protein A7985_21890 [Pseudoalteromonas luteoviolacea]|uniref:Uncharacterized protein n=1 Tax=Pseudoalteromonas luteoviolacea TaxID=43657 RepID=A0A1C0TKL9_9GAMM|nr:DUF6765 family protein [Pseudoalteromonas luteoviolacea]OCQ19099.1 hypothetical protein A7985_21890 [Pseudoalteromonas luteoviolacea]
MDPLFHYYGTYLAALTVGMQAQCAQELAYYTHCATRQTTSNMPRALFYKDYRFTPIVTADAQSELGEHYCNLAFQSLPAFNDAESRSENVARKPRMSDSVIHEVGDSTQLMKYHKPTVVCQGSNITRCYYNPLTDIDWQHGGEFKRHFSERLHKKAFQFEPVVPLQSEQVDAQRAAKHPECQVEHVNLSQVRISQEPTIQIAKLNCISDSAFARKMLNDVIYKRHYDAHIKRISLPLFGCRLYVYQNTWRGLEAPVEAQVSAFRATCYALQSWLNKVPLKHAGNWPVGNLPDAVAKAITQVESLLYSHQYGEHRHRYGDDWARLVAQYVPNEQAASVYGVALRQDHLYEQALIAGKVNHLKLIGDLTEFKRSAWFLFNKAAEYHCDWLARQFCHHELSAFNTRQTLGNLDMWR